MSVSSFTYCVSCNQKGPALGDGGMMGSPDLSVGKDYNDDWGVTTYNFGWIYDGLQSISLLPEEVEAYRSFLETHDGHELFLGNDHMDGSEMPDMDHDNLTRFEFEGQGFIAGCYELSAEGGDSYRTSWDGESFKAFEPRTLTTEDVDNCLERLTAEECMDSITRTTPSVEPYEDLGNIIQFLQGHEDEAITVRLVQAE